MRACEESKVESCWQKAFWQAFVDAVGLSRPLMCVDCDKASMSIDLY